MRVDATTLAEVKVVTPRVFGDARGFLAETFHRERFAEAGLPTAFAQTNHSRSGPGVLRGLHFQSGKLQGKLVQVTRGAVYDVAVDVRRGSPTFGRYASVVLSDENHHMVWIPPGFAHGFAVISDLADVVYHLTSTYDPSDDRGLLWSDPAVGITWPVDDPVLSDRDRANPPLGALDDVLPLYPP
jgi:dTDP-4-dehydrorhamnose 3,5-epimerase